MIYRHTEEQLRSYFNSTAINQSALKVIIDPNGGIEKFVEQIDALLNNEDDFYDEKRHFIIGHAVDTIITQEKEAFKNKYHYSDLKKKPSDTIKAIAKMVFYNVSQDIRIDEVMPFINYKKEIYEAANEYKYSMNRAAPTEKQLKDKDFIGVTDWWNYDNRWASMKNVEYYWNDLILANGKQVLDDGEYNTINNIVISLLTHKHTKHLFVDQPDIDIVYQFPMFWEYMGEKCKGLIDHLIINHKNKRVLSIDEKTLGDYILRFPNAVRKRRYDVQGSWYTFGLHKNLSELSSVIGRNIADYSVANLAFVVESTIKQGIPLVFPMTENLDSIGRFGDGKYLRGWEQALEEYRAWKNINYSIEERFKSSNGIVWIGENFEITN